MCQAAVQQLLTQHPNLSTQVNSLTDASGNTALIIVSEKGHTRIIKVLLDGANVNQKSSTHYGWIAIMKASEMGDSNLEIIDLLLRHGAQVDLQNNEGDTALIITAQIPKLNLLLN